MSNEFDTFPWNSALRSFRVIFLSLCICTIVVFFIVKRAHHFGQMENAYFEFARQVQKRHSSEFIKACLSGEEKLLILRSSGEAICDQLNISRNDRDKILLERVKDLGGEKGVLLRYFKKNEGLFFLKLSSASMFHDGISLGFQRSFFIMALLIITLVSFILAYLMVLPLRASLRRVSQLGQEEIKERSLKDPDSFFVNDWTEVDSAISAGKKNIREKVGLLKAEFFRMKSLLNSLEEPIIALDKENKIVFFNKKMKRMLKDIKQDEILHHSILGELEDSFKAIFETGRTKDIEGFQFEADPRKSAYRISFSPIVQDIARTGVIALFHDSTKQVEVEKMRESFIANVSHELRSPITSIVGYSQLMLESGKLDEEASEMGQKIYGNGKKLGYIIDDLTKLAQVESDFRLEKNVVDIKASLMRSIQEVAAKYHRVKFEVHFDLKVDKMKGDQRLLDLAFHNIISNSFKYSKGDLVLGIQSQLEGEVFSLKIQDNGMGFDPKDEKRVLQRFYRSQNALDSQAGGSGIGLALVKHIIRKHYGVVEIKTSPGQGCLVECQFNKKRIPKDVRKSDG